MKREDGRLVFWRSSAGVYGQIIDPTHLNEQCQSCFVLFAFVCTLQACIFLATVCKTSFPCQISGSNLVFSFMYLFLQFSSLQVVDFQDGLFEPIRFESSKTIIKEFSGMVETTEGSEGPSWVLEMLPKALAIEVCRCLGNLGGHLRWQNRAWCHFRAL